MIAVGLVGSGASLLVQYAIVSPDEAEQGIEYLQRNIEYTQYRHISLTM